jgi:hypothetical protein
VTGAPDGMRCRSDGIQAQQNPALLRLCIVFDEFRFKSA